MPLIPFLVILCLATTTWSAVGIDASATEDSVMKIVYTGGSPTGSQPVLSLSGKKIVTRSVANSTSGARGIIGKVGASTTEPSTNEYIGVLGAAAGIGVFGKSTGYQGWGMQAEASGAYSTGLYSTAAGSEWAYGVMASGTSAYETYGTHSTAYGGTYNYGVYGYAAYASEENWAGWFDGDIYVSGAVNPSDEMFKKDVRVLDGGLAKVMALKPKRYSMKAEEFKERINLPKGEQFGLLAQDVQAVFPELVREATAPPRLTAEERAGKVKKAGLKFKSVNYNGLIPVLLGAIQEQQAQIEELKRQVQQLSRK